MVRHIVVDGANVVGARPDGWWRDRAGAAARLAGELVAALDAGLLDADHVHLVLEGAARAAVVPDHARLSVVRAPADGDSAIVALAAELAAPDAAAPDATPAAAASDAAALDAAASERRAPAVARPTSHTARRPRTGSTMCEDAQGSARSGGGGPDDPAVRTPGGHTAGGRTPDGRGPGGRRPDDPADQSPDGRTPDDPADRSPGGRTPGGRTQGGRTPDGRTPDGRTPGGRTPDGRTPGGRTPDGRTPDGPTPGGPTPGGRRGGDEVTVVTADRGLRARLTVPTVGPATLLARLS